MSWRRIRPIYSDDDYKYWRDQGRKRAAFADKHSHISEKVFKVNDLYIFCIQRKYDACMNKKNQYGVQVWDSDKRDDPGDCLVNKWFDDPAKANDAFLFWKMQCSI